MHGSLSNPEFYKRPSVIHPSSDEFKRKLIVRDPVQACEDIAMFYRRQGFDHLANADHLQGLVAEYIGVVVLCGQSSEEQMGLREAVQDLQEAAEAQAACRRFQPYGIVVDA